jgi:hypothetical protein
MTDCPTTTPTPGPSLKDHVAQLRDKYIGIIAILDHTQRVVGLSETAMDNVEIWVDKVAGDVADFGLFCDAYIGNDAAEKMLAADKAIGTTKNAIEGPLADLDGILAGADEAEVVRRVRYRCGFFEEDEEADDEEADEEADGEATPEPGVVDDSADTADGWRGSRSTEAPPASEATATLSDLLKCPECGAGRVTVHTKAWVRVVAGSPVELGAAHYPDSITRRWPCGDLRRWPALLAPGGAASPCGARSLPAEPSGLGGSHSVPRRCHGLP